MEYVTLALAILAGVASTVAAIFWANDKVKAKEIAEYKTQIFAWDAEVKRAKAEFDEATQRREKVIADFRKEVADLENELAQNRDPAAVRARLGKLLATP